MRANSSYSVSDIERISPDQRNGGLSIPLAELPPIAGGRLSFGVRAVYNSKLRDAKRDEVKTDGIPASTYLKDIPQPGDGGGWRIGAAYSIDFKDSRFDSGRQDRLMIGHNKSRTMRPVSLQSLSYDGKPLLRAAGGEVRLYARLRRSNRGGSPALAWKVIRLTRLGSRESVSPGDGIGLDYSTVAPIRIPNVRLRLPCLTT